MCCQIVKILLICIAASGAFTLSADTASGRIVNGQKIDIERAPFAVQIRLAEHDMTFCGGSLITRSHVLTAAHCITGDALVVVGGANSRNEPGIRRRVVDHRIPKEYSRATMYQDIAVLKLETPMDGKNIGTTSLCSKAWTGNNQIQAFGWGRLSTDGDRSEVLRTVTLLSLSHDECLRRLGYYAENTGSMECTFTADKDFCKGDSGGPGVLNGEVCGVVSGNYGCANPNFPSVFTSVFTMKNFIVDSVYDLP